MKKGLIYGILAVVLMSFTACNDDFLNRPPMDELTDANFWQSEQHMIAATNACYSGLKGKDMLNMYESLGESCPWSSTTSWRTIGGGSYTSEQIQLNSEWVNAYSIIRRCNYFLENYELATSVSAEVRERYAAEVRFHRAYQYLRLTTLFGKVQLVTKTLTVSSPELFGERHEVSDVIDFITNDLETHYQALPVMIQPASTQFGRISQGAALGLLSRIYLYNKRWSEAVSAAERAMTTGYQLYSTSNPSVDYTNLFNFTGRASRVPANKEVMLAYVYNYDLGADARTSHNLSRELWVPNDYSRFAPTKIAIEAYLTSDGKVWNPASVNTYEDLFKDRDPRMSQSLLVPGTAWKGGKDGNPNNENKELFSYPKFSNDKDGAMTYSGYYLRKYVEPSKVGTVSQDDNDIVILRYAEVLLNYAEAKLELGALNQDVIDATINKLRERVGMHLMDLDELAVNGMDLRTEVYRERQVELFFEGHRWIDLIRWGQGNKLGADLVGVRKQWLDPAKLGKTVAEGNALINGLTFSADGYLVIEKGRSFTAPKNELLSLPFRQMERNPNLRPNNPGWN